MIQIITISSCFLIIISILRLLNQRDLKKRLRKANVNDFKQIQNHYLNTNNYVIDDKFIDKIVLKCKKEVLKRIKTNPNEDECIVKCDITKIQRLKPSKSQITKYFIYIVNILNEKLSEDGIFIEEDSYYKSDNFFGYPINYSDEKIVLVLKLKW